MFTFLPNFGLQSFSQSLPLSHAELMILTLTLSYASSFASLLVLLWLPVACSGEILLPAWIFYSFSFSFFFFLSLPLSQLFLPLLHFLTYNNRSTIVSLLLFFSILHAFCFAFTCLLDFFSDQWFLNVTCKSVLFVNVPFLMHMWIWVWMHVKVIFANNFTFSFSRVSLASLQS